MTAREGLLDEVPAEEEGAAEDEEVHAGCSKAALGTCLGKRRGHWGVRGERAPLGSAMQVLDGPQARLARSDPTREAGGNDSVRAVPQAGIPPRGSGHCSPARTTMDHPMLDENNGLHPAGGWCRPKRSNPQKRSERERL